MARKLICRWCGDKSEASEMIKVTNGKTNKYYHKLNCYDEFQAEQAFKEKEAIERDRLYMKVMKIYNVKALPNTYYMQIEGLRHGNRVFKKQTMGKRYREGYDYDLIERAYDASENAIVWSLKNKAFTNLANTLNYGLSIVINNIYEVERKRDSVKLKEHMEEVSDNVKEIDEQLDTFESSYKKKEVTDEDFFDMLD